MGDYTVVRIDDVEGAYGGALKKLRSALGVTSFGMQVIDIPPNATMYPDHDHNHDGQEEVYVVLRGAGEIEIDGTRVAIDAEHVVRVGPGAKRKILPGPEGLRVLALGGAPGKAYEVPPFTEIGAADPIAG